jgi:hypothetical protein
LPPQQTSSSGVWVELVRYAQLHWQPKEDLLPDQGSLRATLADEVLGDKSAHQRNKEGEVLWGYDLLLEPVTERLAEFGKIKRRAALMQPYTT